MSIRIELGADKDQGPGYGVIRIGGFGAGAGPVDFSLMRNQGSQPYLGRGRVWQAMEAWHSATALADGTDLIIPVGPDIVDPIVGQPTTVAYRLTLASGTTRDAGVLRINRPLLGSGAAAGDDGAEAERLRREEEARRAREDEERRQREDEERRRREDEAERRRREEQEQTVTPPPAPPRRWPLIAVLALLLIASGAFGAWYGCLIPGFAASRCEATTAATTPPAPPEPPPTEPSPAPATALSCVGLAGDACYRVAQRALADRQFEPARQLLQQAAQLGFVEANNAVARLYDPQTWTKETSPAAEPNWETAVYWYERAARQGDAAGQLGAGRLLCRHAASGFEHKQGLQYLRQAAAQAASPEIQTLIAECEAKAS